MRSRLSLLAIFWALLISQSLTSQSTINGTLSFEGLEREYILYVPASYNGTQSVPLVFNFHGYTSSAAAQIVYGDFRPIADRENFLIVHPQGSIGDDGETYFNADWVEGGVDDVGFTGALLDQLSTEYNINMDRVYSTGMSNGGFMSYTLACELSDRIAAIASVTGSMTRPQLTTCDPEHIVPIMEIHGTSDAVVPYEGNNWMAPLDEVLNFWITNNDCADVQVTMIQDNDPNDQSTVERHVYTDCAEATTIELFKVENGGHTWPGSAIQFGVTNNDINASEEVWRFFSQYDLNGPISSSKEVVEDANLLLYPSLVTDMVSMAFDTDGQKEISIWGINGEIIVSEVSQGRYFSFRTSELPLGLYVVQVREGRKLRATRFVKI